MSVGLVRRIAGELLETTVEIQQSADQALLVSENQLLRASPVVDHVVP